jgi:hypothetical protein
MITGNFLELETDKDEQKEIVDLYNTWSNINQFSSHYPCQGSEWEELKKYCIDNPELTKELFLDIYNAFDGEVGFFTQVLPFVFPGLVEVVDGYVPLKIYTQIWWEVLKPNSL